MIRPVAVACLASITVLHPTFTRADTSEASPTPRDQVKTLVAQDRVSEAAALLEELSRAKSGDHEDRQYALLTLGELYLLRLDRPAEAVRALEKLVSEYHCESPYVASARYDLGSFYMDRGDAVRAFTNLARVPATSPRFGDAQTKLDWATRNLRPVIELPFGFEILPARLGVLALLADGLFILLGIVQTATNGKPNRKLLWGALAGLAVLKIGLSIQIMRLG